MTTLPDIEFHNVPQPEPWPFGPGWLLARYPRSVSNVINIAGRQTSVSPGSCEIRFVSESPTIRVYLSAPDWECEVTVLCGEFNHSVHKLAPGKVHCVHLQFPEKFSQTLPEALNHGGFAPDVWRLVLTSGKVLFHGIDTLGYSLRAPLASEKPRIQWLAYGSSITHSHAKGYVHQAAARLGVDVQNKGLSGSCHIEKEASDFLARECTWDFATLELGINMRSLFTPEEFDRRARYLVEACVSAKPGKPVFLISIFPNYVGQAKNPDHLLERENAFKASLRTIANEQASRNVHLLEGSAILDDFRYLGADLLHPSDYGHVRMGENLARLLKPIVDGL